MGRGKLEFKGREVGIDLCARVGRFGPKSENQAAGARFLRTNHGGPLDWVEGTYLGRGELRFKGWEVGINWRARVEGFGRKPKNRATEVLFWLMQCRGW